MPIARVQMDDGKIARFEVPEGMSPAEVEKFAYQSMPSNVPDIKPEDASKPLSQSLAETGKGLASGALEGGTLGFGDEAMAGLAASIVKGVGLVNPAAAPNTWQEEYDRALGQVRGFQNQSAEDAPIANFVGNIAGGSILGGAIGSQLAGTKLGKIATKYPKTAAGGAGVVSGGLYGAGTGEGGFGERAEQAGTGALFGGGGGVAGAYVGQKIYSLAERAKKLIDAKKVSKSFDPLTASNDLDALAEQQAVRSSIPDASVAEKSGELSAYSKVIDKIKSDYPENWQEVANAWQQSKQPLIDASQGDITTLAKGAAQYPSGGKVLTKFFDDKIAGTAERAAQSLPKNNFYQTVDNIVSSGRKEASPLYEKSFASNARVAFKDGVIPQEIQDAIARARSKYPSATKDLPDDSIKVLHYAKLEMDDQIGSAIRAGEENFVADRTGIVSDLTKRLKDASGDYKKGNAVSGDYLSARKYMQEGTKILEPKTRSDLVDFNMKKMSAADRNSYRSGVLQAIKSKIDDTATSGSNPYTSIMGTKDKVARLSKVLKPDEFKALEKTLKAEDRLFRERNIILGGSPTVSKAMAAAELASGAAQAIDSFASGGIKGAGVAGATSLVKKIFDGLDDKKAGYIAKIITETDPAKKVVLLERMGAGSDNLTKAEQQLVKKYYFTLDGLIKSRTAGASSGGVFGNTLIPGKVKEADYPEFGSEPMPKDGLRMTIPRPKEWEKQ